MKPKQKIPTGFIELGRYYGYPDCCIAEFIEYVLALRKGLIDRHKPRKLHGTGYVPCKACNKKSKKELLSQIVTNRKCDLPFPQQYD